MKLNSLRLSVLLLAVWLIAYAVLPLAVNVLVYKLLSLEEGTRLTSSLYFFLYEAPKVLLLMVIVVFGVGIVRSYFSPEKTRKVLENKPLLLGNVLASALGIVTPFCSCSAVPLFIGFVEAGIPLGVTFSFLTAAPMINEIAVVLLFGLFGWRVALLYVSMGLAIAILAGYVINKLNVERYVEDWVYAIRSKPQNSREEVLTLNARVEFGFTQVREIVSKVWVYLLVGIAVGAGILRTGEFYGRAHGEVGVVGSPRVCPHWCSALFQRGRHYSCSARAARKRGFPRHDACLYDVGHWTVASGDHHSQEGLEAPVDFHLCGRCWYGHYAGGLPLQRHNVT